MPRIAAGRNNSRITAHFFRNLGFSGFLGENGLFLSRKNYPNRPLWLAKLRFYGLEYGETKRRLFRGSGIPRKTGKKPTFLLTPLLRRRLASREGVPTPQISLIREKTALMFWDIPVSKPVWQSGEFSQRKITANSTYWEAKVRCRGGWGSGRGLWEGEKGG